MLEFHEAANIFPLDEGHIEELSLDIIEHGLQVPIETLDGKIIDGRRRWLACENAGVKPTFKAVSPTDPIAYVLSLNLYRRHLTPSQLAMVGARARECYDRQAQERREEGQRTGGRGHKKNSVENLPPSSEPGKARDHVGKVVGVSGKSIDYATKVIKNAVPEVIQAVDQGRMAVSTAAILSSEPEEKQREEATQPKRNRKYKAGYGGGEPEPREEESKPDPDPDTDPEARQVRGVGITRANEAINCLIRIPKNDALRKRGFQLVTDWIKRNR